MNNEIKEILENVFDLAISECPSRDIEKIKKVKDYINNLQEENKRLKDNFDFNLDAIENIRKQKDYFEDMCAIRTQALLDIKEYIETNPNIEILLKDSIKDFLDHDELIERKQYQHILDIVNKAIGDDKSE